MDNILTHFTDYLMIAWALVYLGIVVLILRRRGWQDSIIRYLLAYSLASVVVELFVALVRLGLFLPAEQFFWLPVYGAALLLWLFLALSDQFLNRQLHIWWLGLGGIWLGVLLVLWVSTGFPDTVLTSDGVHNTLLWLTAFTGLIYLLRVGFLTLIAFNQSRQPLYRNRIVYWALALLFILIGDALVLTEYLWLGTLLRLIGGIAAVYAVWSYHQANLLQMSLRLASYLIVVLFDAGLFAVGYYGLRQAFGPENSITVGLIVALAVVLAIFSGPIINWINHALTHRVFGEGYDTSQVVRNYSLGITNIVDVRRLSQTSLELVAKAFDVQQGLFCLVDQEQADNRDDYWVRPVANLDKRERASGRLQASNPLIQHFVRDRQPVMQYDIEVLPEFKDMDEGESIWLSDLGVDVYIPICAPSRLLGLLALGSRHSGGQYSAEDLLLMTTLAEQTVVALENARLLADLEVANNNLQTAILQLERANNDLKEIDELKTSFIGVVSHEMRTPLANVGFSMQIFERHGLDNLKPGQLEEFQELKNSFHLATMMIENLVMLASFLNNQVGAQIESFDMRLILQNVMSPFLVKAQKKEIQMKMDIIGEVPPLLADRRLLSNAIYQLIHNAVKFTDSGGKIWVTCWATATTICVDIKDTGRGIPADRLQEMWLEFTQMADPLKRGLEGLGLGLALVRHIIALHGGEVWAESTLGQGSVFGFQVPIAGPKQPASPKEIFRRRMMAERN
jgi:signal transduction histidine kinase